MWSQLFYDSVVPFDSNSKREIKNAGYTDPRRDFLAMNRELFDFDCGAHTTVAR
jgi:hypothetical protein